MTWRLRAACRSTLDPEAWSTPPGQAKLTARNLEAIGVCLACPVRAECGQEALEIPADRRQGVILAGVAFNARGVPRERSTGRRQRPAATRHAETSTEVMHGHARVA